MAPSSEEGLLRSLDAGAAMDDVTAYMLGTATLTFGVGRALFPTLAVAQTFATGVHSLLITILATVVAINAGDVTDAGVYDPYRLMLLASAAFMLADAPVWLAQRSAIKAADLRNTMLHHFVVCAASLLLLHPACRHDAIAGLLHLSEASTVLFCARGVLKGSGRVVPAWLPPLFHATHVVVRGPLVVYVFAAYGTGYIAKLEEKPVCGFFLVVCGFFFFALNQVWNAAIVQKYAPDFFAKCKRHSSDVRTNDTDNTFSDTLHSLDKVGAKLVQPSLLIGDTGLRPWLASVACAQGGRKTYRVRCAGSNKIYLGAMRHHPTEGVDVENGIRYNEARGNNENMWCFLLNNHKTYLAGARVVKGRTVGPGTFEAPFTLDVIIDGGAGTLAVAVVEGKGKDWNGKRYSATKDWSGVDLGVVIRGMRTDAPMHLAVGTNDSRAQVRLA